MPRYPSNALFVVDAVLEREQHGVRADQRADTLCRSVPGDGPPRHIHYGSDELFYILEGEFLFLVGERQESVSAGTYIFVRRGTVHAYKAVGTEQGRLLMAFIPGGPERLAEQFVKLSTEGEGVNRSMAQLNKMFAELNEKYDSEFVGPPLQGSSGTLELRRTP